jgi:hypothetical protein
MTNLNTNVDHDIQETTVEGVEGILSKWNLPEQVASFLSNIKKSKSKNY